MMNVQAAVRRYLEATVALRRELHRIPELGYEEVKTAARIRQELDALHLRHIDGVEGAATATVAWLGDAHKPCIALRADIDALPILERTGLPYASEHVGKMHACGHDGHAAALVGAAAVLRELEEQLPVSVKLIWQPAEESGGGALRLVQAGVLDGRVGPRAVAVFALHGWPGLKIGTVSTKAGVLLAATDNFRVVFHGRGCHGGYPHLGRDPVVAVCEAVLSIQQIVSREMDPTEGAVVTVGQLEAGSAVNIIPDKAVLSGTVRTLTDQSRRRIREYLQRRCLGVAQASGCQLEFTWMDGYPATINDPGMTDHVARVARTVLGEAGFVPAAKPSLGGEDFSYYLEKCPGCMFLVGVERPGQSECPALHTDRYDFPDEALATAVTMLAELAMRFGQDQG